MNDMISSESQKYNKRGRNLFYKALVSENNIAHVFKLMIESSNIHTLKKKKKKKKKKKNKSN